MSHLGVLEILTALLNKYQTQAYADDLVTCLTTDRLDNDFQKAMRALDQQDLQTGQTTKTKL